MRDPFWRCSLKYTGQRLPPSFWLQIQCNGRSLQLQGSRLHGHGRPRPPKPCNFQPSLVRNSTFHSSRQQSDGQQSDDQITLVEHISVGHFTVLLSFTRPVCWTFFIRFVCTLPGRPRIRATDHRSTASSRWHSNRSLYQYSYSPSSIETHVELFTRSPFAMLPLATVGVAFLAASTALAANTVSCGLGNLCPTDLPCCSRE